MHILVSLCGGECIHHGHLSAVGQYKNRTSYNQDFNQHLIDFAVKKVYSIII